MNIEVDIERRQRLWCAIIHVPGREQPQGCWATTVPTAQVRAIKWLRDNGFGGMKIRWTFKKVLNE